MYVAAVLLVAAVLVPLRASAVPGWPALLSFCGAHTPKIIMLLIARELGCKQMGVITRAEWMEGMRVLQ